MRLLFHEALRFPWVRLHASNLERLLLATINYQILSIGNFELDRKCILLQVTLSIYVNLVIEADYCLAISGFRIISFRRYTPNSKTSTLFLSYLS